MGKQKQQQQQQITSKLLDIVWLLVCIVQ